MKHIALLSPDYSPKSSGSWNWCSWPLLSPCPHRAMACLFHFLSSLDPCALFPVKQLGWVGDCQGEVNSRSVCTKLPFCMRETEARGCVFWALWVLGQPKNPSTSLEHGSAQKVGGQGHPEPSPLPDLCQRSQSPLIDSFALAGGWGHQPRQKPASGLCLPTHLGSWLQHPTWVGGVGMCVKGDYSCHCSFLISFISFTSLTASPEATLG